MGSNNEQLHFNSTQSALTKLLCGTTLTTHWLSQLKGRYCALLHSPPTVTHISNVYLRVMMYTAQVPSVDHVRMNIQLAAL